jgi:hypothetical protein
MRFNGGETGRERIMHARIGRAIRQARLRWDADLLLNLLGGFLAGAGIVLALMILVERLLAVTTLTPPIGWTLAAAVVLCWAGVWLVRRPTAMQVAIAVDERLKLAERISTAIAIQGRSEPFAQAAYQETVEKTESIRIPEHFPIRFKRPWGYGIASWAVVLLISVFVPQYDLLGRLREERQTDELAQQQQQVQTQIRQTTTLVQQAVEQLGKSELQDELADLKQASAANPDEMKRQAIRKLGDLSEQIKQMQAGMKPESMEAMETALRQLRPVAEAFSQQFEQALAKGNFQKAAEVLAQMQKDLQQSKLSEEQKQQLAKQLGELSKQLQGLAQNKSGLEKTLEQMGLDKKLAQMDPKQMQQSLQKLGLTPEQIQKLMEQAQACQGACDKLGQLAAAMAAAGANGAGMSGQDLENLAAQLNALDNLQQQMKLSEATLKQIYSAMQCLGEGMCQGQGQCPWKEGESNRRGRGSGGPGQGEGPRDSDTEGQTGTTSTRVQGPSGQGPAVASWFVKGSQVKGEAKKEFGQAVSAGSSAAQEAISDNQIPRKYEESIKKYFGQLEKVGDK